MPFDEPIEEVDIHERNLRMDGKNYETVRIGDLTDYCFFKVYDSDGDLLFSAQLSRFAIERLRVLLDPDAIGLK